MARVTNAASKPLDDALARMIAAAPAGIGVSSEVRDAAKQQQLWDAAVKKYGSEAEARKWVAPPGHSQHQLGHAADLSFATPAAKAWAHANAARFGLVFPLGNEPWHVEVVGARSATVAATKANPAVLTDQQVRDYVISHYGYAASYLHDPEIGPILLDAAKRGLGEDELRGKLSATKWWKTHSDSQVAWDNLNEQNPATAQAKVQATMSTIGAVAQQRGIALSGLQIHDLAVLDLRNGWNEDQLTNAMAYHAKLDPTVGGKGATTKDVLKQQASQYLVPVADSTLDKWALDIGSGKVSQENFQSYLRGMAKSLHPDAATAIDSGVTTAQYYDPYKQIAADTLDVPVESVNFSDPKWSRALFQIDPKTGARTTMSLADWGQTLRTDPTYGYSKTAKANSTAADFAQMLTQKWGAVAS